MNDAGPSILGVTPDGAPIHAFDLARPSGFRATVCTLGASLIALQAPDAKGRLADVVLNYPPPDPVRHQAGATVGRFAGPIAGGVAHLDGALLALPCNGGRYHIHGGEQGFSRRLWNAETRTTPEGPAVRFSRLSPDGEEGYPGNLAATVTYTLVDGGLRLDYEAQTDRTTLCNLTNHTYFNLAGHDSGSVLNHRVQIDADTFNPNDADIIATGLVAPVRGTPFDFTAARAIGERIEADDEQIRFGQGYDHNFLLPPDSRGSLRRAAVVTEPGSGRRLEMWTTEPGFQFYTGNGLPAGERGKNGAMYGKWQGFCLEAQRAPNWPERPGVAAAVLRPGALYRQTTLYRFSCT